ncbi:MAG: SAM-dependent DNA methyltransferase [Saprospiraceae bacterium]|uniref:site-specific DNA-methyltransferase (adenine-specific) n=1 Tax=Candidatus Opimibacter skivensis TaxID=2982028 RepID=A0A9D7T000_9BACT|nr:SAM-dependent DNA methyltransferase [Candidatus Opimibacter skivensis]
MTNHLEHTQKTKELIDGLKTVCSNYGLANTGYEYKIITEGFLYKFLNDKFLHEARNANKKLKDSKNIEADIQNMSDNDYEYMLEKIGERSAKLKKTHFISYLFNKQNEKDFSITFDTTLTDIAATNIKIFSVSTIGGEKIPLFEELSENIREKNERSPFCKAIINKLVAFSFEPVFEEKYDFFSTIFEYLIKDYNKDSGQYAEYYTPPTVAKIMARILVPKETKNVLLYDPAAGSGSLLLSLAHQIGEDKCTIYSQDISQKSSEFLRLNLILNNLVHSLHNVIKGNSLTIPFHVNDAKDDLKKFDYIVSNPPFKTDFSDDRETLASDIHKKRFFAGVPSVPAKKKESMAIYQLFIQHIMYSLDTKGKAAVVVPTGFCTEKAAIGFGIRKKIVDSNWLHAVVQMPPNIFANTGTNVSVVFIDKSKTTDKVIFVDASKLGKKVKEGKNKKTLLSADDENKIINAINNKEVIEDFSIEIDNKKIEGKKYSFGAGQYFETRIEYCELTSYEFDEKMQEHQNNLAEYFNDGKKLEKDILKNFKIVSYE